MDHQNYSGWSTSRKGSKCTSTGIGNLCPLWTTCMYVNKIEVQSKSEGNTSNTLKEILKVIWQMKKLKRKSDRILITFKISSFNSTYCYRRPLWRAEIPPWKALVEPAESVSILLSISGLTCHHCTQSKSNGQCNLQNITTVCAEQDVCYTEVQRPYLNEKSYTKVGFLPWT